jgi:hypothetical protein
MDAGFGIPTMAMSGTLLIHGDLLPTTMADGTGTPFIIGIGYLVIAGLPPGYPGSGMIITMAGAPSVGGIGLWSFTTVIGGEIIVTGMAFLFTHDQPLSSGRASYHLPGSIGWH